MKGFFDDDFDTDPSDRACAECGLYRGCYSPKMPYTGGGRLGILQVAEAPGEEEDRVNRQLVGQAGTLWAGRLKPRGYSLHDDFWKTNAIICRPDKNRTPTPQEILLCRPNLMATIRELNPRQVWLLGGTALESYFYGQWDNLSPSRWRNLCIPDYENDCWVLPMFHPSYALRNDRDGLVQSVFNRDLDFAISAINMPRPSEFGLDRPDVNSVIILRSFEDITAFLRQLIVNPPEFLAFDYETTGLKPYRAGHRLAVGSVCFSKDRAYSFPLQHRCWSIPERKTIEGLWKQVLLGSSKKIAHNLKFEHVWSRSRLKVWPANWHWCTMLTAHSLDNRSQFTSLKFQSFIRWGIPDYSKEISRFLEDVDSKGFNRVFEAPQEELLRYAALDALMTFWLFLAQREEVDDHLKTGQELFREGSIYLGDTEMNGINMDKEYYVETKKEVDAAIKKAKEALYETEDAELFRKNFGRTINVTSNKDLSNLFYKLHKFPVKKETDSKNPSIDASVIATFDTPLARGLTEVKKLEKVSGTYLAQFIREIDDDGRVHPFFDLVNPKTFRGSSNKPNWQNVPTRDKVSKKYSRSGIIPSPGYQIGDWDYKQIEVKMATCYTHDPALIAYNNDPTTDMHRDQAMICFGLPADEITKDIRGYVKNGFVFPEWYGSTHKACAKRLLQECKDLPITSGTPMFDHLVDCGIITRYGDHLAEFTAHIKDTETALWERFHVFREWQQRQFVDFEKYGYIEMFTGFRCSGYMTRNHIINYRFQGSAFHCLLWSLIEVIKEIKKRRMRSMVIGQIHDCCVNDVFPAEREELVHFSTEIATRKLREHWPWLIVPMDVDWEFTQVDGSWFAKEKYKFSLDDEGEELEEAA